MSGPMKDEHLVMLGRIVGTQESHGQVLQQQEQMLQSIDSRLRTQEQKAAAAGAVSGGVVSVGIALLIEGLKGWMGRGGGGNP